MTDRNTMREVVGKEITDVSNYPTDIQCNLWGANLKGLIDRTTDAVVNSLVYEYALVVVEGAAHGGDDDWWFPTEEERDETAAKVAIGFPHYKLKFAKRLKQGRMEYQEKEETHGDE